MSYASLADLHAYLGISASLPAVDALLQRVLDAATAAIDTYTGRTFAAATDTTRTLDGNDTMLWLDTDLAQITSVTNAGVAVALSDIHGFPNRNARPYAALRLASGSWGEAAITGRWAYSVTPTADIVQACVRWAAYFYRLKDSQIFEASASPDTGQVIVLKGTPPDVKALIHPYRSISV